MVLQSRHTVSRVTVLAPCDSDNSGAFRSWLRQRVLRCRKADEGDSVDDTFRSCSCAGLNENCYKCGGTGISGTMPGKPGPPLSTEKMLIGDQITGIFSIPGQRENKDRIDSIHCSVCNLNFNRMYWRKHLRTAHGSRQESLRLKASTKSVSLSTCPFCGQRILTGRLMKHLKKVRRSRRPSLLPVDHQISGNTEASFASLKNEQQERLLDSTKNYGFPCRENGRYGSHPSHDGFDDESSP